MGGNNKNQKYKKGFEPKLKIKFFVVLWSTHQNCPYPIIFLAFWIWWFFKKLIVILKKKLDYAFVSKNIEFVYFLSIEINTKIVWFLEYQCARKLKKIKALPTYQPWKIWVGVYQTYKWLMLALSFLVFWTLFLFCANQKILLLHI